MIATLFAGHVWGRLASTKVGCLPKSLLASFGRTHKVILLDGFVVALSRRLVSEGTHSNLSEDVLCLVGGTY